MNGSVLGLDIGGVLMDLMLSQRMDPTYVHNHLEVPPVADAIESAAALNTSEKFRGRMYLITRYRGDSARYIQEWLDHQDFFKRTGMPLDHLYPCPQRGDKQAIAKRLGVMHFVDDRAEVLATLIDTVPNLYLFQNLDEKPDAFIEERKRMHFFETWKDLLPVLLR